MKHQLKVVSNLKSELNDITQPINLLKEKIKTVADVDSDLIRNVLKFIHDYLFLNGKSTFIL